MFKLSAATLAAFYCVLLVFGDESRRPDAEATRTAPDNISLTQLASFVEISGEELTAVSRADRSGLSDAEAIAMALEAGREHRAGRKSAPLRGVIIPVAATETEATAESEVAAMNLWEVTGSRVNLRAGPSTGDAVVGQLSLGTEATVLDQGGGWYRIETADGQATGWIFGKFLSRKG